MLQLVAWLEEYRNHSSVHPTGMQALWTRALDPNGRMWSEADQTRGSDVEIHVKFLSQGPLGFETRHRCQRVERTLLGLACRIRHWLVSSDQA